MIEFQKGRLLGRARDVRERYGVEVVKY